MLFYRPPFLKPAAANYTPNLGMALAAQVREEVRLKKLDQVSWNRGQKQLLGKIWIRNDVGNRRASWIELDSLGDL